VHKRKAERVLSDTVGYYHRSKLCCLGIFLQNKKALYALVCETIKNQETLSTLKARCPDLMKEKELKDDDLMSVLLYEHFVGRGVRGKFKVSL